jgi:uncharacterized protein (DUF1778 family)
MEQFYLSEDQWEAFVAILDAPPEETPKLAESFSQPSPFDEEEK